MPRLSSLLAVASTFASFVSAALPTISVTGSKFFTSDGYQFYIKGVAYQLTEFDPLKDTAQCERDAALMQTLGANSIRVYHTDGTADHTGCMNAFAARGIYLWVDLDSFTTYLGYAGTGPSWDTTKSDTYRRIMDNFAQYENTAGFFIGNEIVGSKNDTGVAPYMLAAKADLAAYGKAKGYRNIPIGYSQADIPELDMLMDYVACQPNATDRLDFYALNTYRWCGQTTFLGSGYDKLQAAAVGYPIPIFISETGCNNIRPRAWGEMASIYGPDMVDTFSGSIVYEWIQEWNNFGLVQYGAPAGSSQAGSQVITSYPISGTPTPLSPDFTNLQNAWATLSPVGVNASQYAAGVQTTPRSCPATGSMWTVNPTAPLPTLGQAALAGVTPGPVSGVPQGNITVSGTLSRNTSAPSPYTGSHVSSASASASDSSATHATSSGAGVRNMAISHIQVGEVYFFHAFMTLAGISVAAMLLL